MTAHALIIGEAPSRTSRSPIDGRVGRRLEQLAGIAPGELDLWFALGNLLPAQERREHRPGPHNSPGDGFDMEHARRNWETLLEERFLHDFDFVVLLGQRVRRAAGLAELPWFSWLPFFENGGRTYPGFRDADPVPLYRADVNLRFQVAVFPHPSGTSHFWNDPDRRAERFMVDLVRRLCS